MSKEVTAVTATVENAIAAVTHRHPRDLVASPHFGVRMAAVVAQSAGSWKFILSYLVFTAVYTLGHQAGVFAFDPYPYQFYTFLVSVLAILLAQTILLFQNQQAAIENEIAHNAYAQVEELDAMQHTQTAMLEAMQTLLGDVHTIAHRLDQHIAATGTRDVPTP